MIQSVNSSNPPAYDERSAGGIVFKLENGKLLWLLIKTLANRSQQGIRLFLRPPKLLYKFPKGHVNPNEFLKAAALREVEEEAWVKANIVTKLGSNDYVIWDKESKKKIVKKVTFFLMEYTAPSPSRYHDAEGVVGKDWLSFEKAYDLLAYDSEKDLLKKAKDFVENALA